MSAPVTHAQARLAGLITVLVAGFWGIYWVPVRRLDALGLPAAWGSLAVVLVALLILAPVAVTRRRQIAAAGPYTLIAIALGGVAFVFYSVALIYGRVAIVILLFYLTPVWSTVIGRLWLGWRTPLTRYAALVAGLVGLVLVMGIDNGLPLPRNLGEWLGLTSGVLWSISTTGMRVQETPLGAAETGLVFVFGGSVSAVILATALAPWPGLPAPGDVLAAGLWVLATATVWWVVSVVAILWAASRLEPARMGILQTSEVLVGVASAAAFAGEHMGMMEFVGGVLIIVAAVLEIVPARPAAAAAGRGSNGAR